jgi:hypothetical protein
MQTGQTLCKTTERYQDKYENIGNTMKQAYGVIGLRPQKEKRAYLNDG